MRRYGSSRRGWQDYGAVLVSPKGEVFAAPRRYGVLMMIGMPMDDAIARMGDDVRDGDLFISNDPDSTGGMVTHLSDVFLWKPVLIEARFEAGDRVAASEVPEIYEALASDSVGSGVRPAEV